MSDDVIDLEALRRLLEVIGGDPEDLEELLEEFEEVGPSTLKTMQDSASADDLDTLRISSHGLKSNARDFGATALATACEVLEHACKAGEVEDPVAQVQAISVELDRARAALKAVSLS